MDTESNARTNALDLFRLDGKTAIVTGGGRGLGQYMAEALSDAGAGVVLCSRKLEALEEVRAEIEAAAARPWPSPATSRTRRTWTELSPRRRKPSAG